jgi:hypothetical protein
MDAKWAQCKKENKLVKLGGGFYCGLIDGLYVFNGFFMSMRAKYTSPVNTFNDNNLCVDSLCKQILFLFLSFSFFLFVVAPLRFISN